MTADLYATATGLIERSAAAYVSGVPEDAADDGLLGPASLAWRVSTDLASPVAGIRSLLMQALHPLAMAGVDQHSGWRRDPVGRQDRDHPVNSQGLPLYYYPSDTAAKSAVTGGLAALWPPLTSASPAAAGLTGKLTAVSDAHGDQVAYNGHLLYTFADDQPGQVTGQGVQGFFVATPSLTAITGSQAATGTAPPAPSGNPYGY